MDPNFLNSQNIYLTTTLPYVNAKPHIGFALEIVQADFLARAHRLAGRSVLFNFGTDEHGQKIYQKAKELNLEVQEYVDRSAEQFQVLRRGLNLSYDNFIRTTDPVHVKAAQEFWRRCRDNGDIYQARYQVKYCVGCELEKTESELVNGVCPLHPDWELELIDEENYFFRFSRYTERLLELYQQQPEFVRPNWRQKEVAGFVSQGLRDFSISRLKSKMPWGVPVPDDPDHVMYVWFDALVNYVSTLGWPETAQRPRGKSEEPGDFDKWWPVIQLAGKDNLRQQAAMWQAMLLSAGLPPSRQIMIHGFINDGLGQKMSKSSGNVIDPLELVENYGTEAVRYYLLRHINPFEDFNFSSAYFLESYNAHLANGLGNLVSRIMKMASTHLSSPITPTEPELSAEMQRAIDEFRFDQALEVPWRKIAYLDDRIAETRPFKLIKTEPERAKTILRELLDELYGIGHLLLPAMPATGQKIKDLVAANEMPSEPLFIRREI